MAVERMGFAGGLFTNIIGSVFDGLVFEEAGESVVGWLVIKMLERMGWLSPTRLHVNDDFAKVENILIA